MRKLFGMVCILLGALCIIGSVCFVGYNFWEAENATKLSGSLLQEAQAEIGNQETQDGTQNMATVKAGEYDCIGILKVPNLELELPVLTNWSYEKLKKAPCLYYGSCYEKNFVIAAHNYASHFGRLSELRAGDLVLFTDAKGTEYYYEVVLLETLPKNATEEMITSGFDLSLYTCTRGGGNRVTARCRLLDKG